MRQALTIATVLLAMMTASASASECATRFARNDFAQFLRNLGALDV